MPDIDDTRPGRRRRPEPPSLTATLWDLDGAHARAAGRGDGEAEVSVGDSRAEIHLIGEPATIRQLLTDAVAQLEAIEAGR